MSNVWSWSFEPQRASQSIDTQWHKQKVVIFPLDRKTGRKGEGRRKQILKQSKAGSIIPCHLWELSAQNFAQSTLQNVLRKPVLHLCSLQSSLHTCQHKNTHFISVLQPPSPKGIEQTKIWTIPTKQFQFGMWDQLFLCCSFVFLSHLHYFISKSRWWTYLMLPLPPFKFNKLKLFTLNKVGWAESLAQIQPARRD